MFNKYMVISLLIIISGCNSDNSNVDSEAEIRDLPPVSSEVFPPESSKMESVHLFGPDSVVQNQTIKIKVFAGYSNQTQKDVSSEVNWHVSDQKIATINTHGELLGLVPGTVDITAEKEGLVTKQFLVTVKTHLMSCGLLNDSDKSNAKGACLKVVKGQAGEAEHKLFTSPPSVNVMALLGYEINDTKNNTGKTYASTQLEGNGGKPCKDANELERPCGPDDGVFARFRQDGKGWEFNPLNPDFGKMGQYDRFCQELSLIGFFGKDDWRRITEDEIDNLVKGNGSLFDTYGWPIRAYYWSDSKAFYGNQWYFVAVGGFIAKNHHLANSDVGLYGSCVSETL